jgi:glycosyltransferase involved in cell wall biosynthesis
MLYQVPKPEGKKVLCTCGRLSKEKGFDLAVKTAHVLKENGVSFHWYFVGDGPERGNVEYLIGEYKLDNYITITGMLDNPYPYIAGCDIYVQTSYEESYGLTIKEALILRRAVVSTNTIGGELLIDTEEKGVLVECNAEQIAKTIEQLLKNKKAKETPCSDFSEVGYMTELERYQEKWRTILRS